MAHKVETLVWSDGTHFHHYRNIAPATKQDWIDWATKVANDPHQGTRELVKKINADTDFVVVLHGKDMSEAAAKERKRWLQRAYEMLPAHEGRMIGKLI